MSLLSRLTNIVIVPGNGCTPVKKCNWYFWLYTELKKMNIKVNMEMHTMPDPYLKYSSNFLITDRYEAKESIWLPHMREKLNTGPGSIIVGHSSGAEAAMRFAETDKVLGLVLVSACHTDQGTFNNYLTIRNGIRSSIRILQQTLAMG
jgi:hypothetical protein